MSDPLNRPGASTMTPSLRLLPYDSTWAARFDAEADRMRLALGTMAVTVEHVGSTAVPGLDGKPVLDIAMNRDYLWLGTPQGLIRLRRRGDGGLP